MRFRVRRVIAASGHCEVKLKMTRCDGHKENGCMATKTQCITHDLWEGLGKQIFNYLHGISLADVRKKKGSGHWSAERFPALPG